ncbi:MAG: tRNA adenosine(34) deaminase TadA [Burkholderiales bacterium]
MDDDERYMREALKMARKAANIDEVPVGAVVVRGGKVISRAHNLRETKKDPLAHAETIAIRRASRKLRGWRLEGCTIYVTLEPCPMCAGAIVNSRIEQVVFGAYDPKAGAFGSLYDLGEGRLNHKPKVTGGVLKDECAKLLKDYFAAKRS